MWYWNSPPPTDPSPSPYPRSAREPGAELGSPQRTPGQGTCSVQMGRLKLREGGRPHPGSHSTLADRARTETQVCCFLIHRLSPGPPTHSTPLPSFQNRCSCLNDFIPSPNPS